MARKKKAPKEERQSNASSEGSEPPSDPTLNALMQDAFGPPEAGPNEETPGPDKLERGLDAVAQATAPQTAGSGPEWIYEGAPNPRHDEACTLVEPRRCFACGTPSPKQSCGKCGVAGYCSRECQTGDWGKRGAWGGHKAQCAEYKALGRMQHVEAAGRRTVIESLLAKLRLTLCPFALGNGSGGLVDGAPRGFVFAQVGCTLAQCALPAPRCCDGRQMMTGERAALLHFCTLAEFDAEIAASDPALAAARKGLADADARHAPKEDVVVMVRTACGFVGVVLQPIVPDWRVAVQLAREHEGNPELEVQIDDDENEALLKNMMEKLGVDGAKLPLS